MNQVRNFFTRISLREESGAVGAATSKGLRDALGSGCSMEVQENGNASIFEHCTPLALEWAALHESASSHTFCICLQDILNRLEGMSRSRSQWIQ